MIWITLRHKEGQKYWMYLKLGEYTFRSEFPLFLREINEAMDAIDIEETAGMPSDYPQSTTGIEK